MGYADEWEARRMKQQMAMLRQDAKDRAVAQTLDPEAYWSQVASYLKDAQQEGGDGSAQSE